MTIEHDPIRQINYIRQCLSQDKKPLGIFLAAGCPMAVKVGDEKNQPLIPDIAGMTKAVREKLEKCKDCGPILKVVEDHFKKDGLDGATVEDMLSHVRALRVVAGKEKVRGLTAEELDRLDSEICKIIHELADKSLPDTATPYHRIALWADATKRENPVEVFTTNYDLLMEQAFEDCRVPYFDGFAGSRKPFFDIRAMEEDRLPERWARLWKLHGSINWYQDTEKGVLRGASNEEGLKRVIHPSHLKYEESRRMPYLAMIDKLRAFLKQPSVALILCGYSFRDDHINEVIIQGLQATQTAIAFALLFEPLGSYPKAVKLAVERTNLSLLARDGAVISGREAKWPEKAAEFVDSDSPDLLKRIQIDPKDDKSKRKTELQLGDFLVFGGFLQELVGQGWERSEASNAK